jgi:hypothetical protein
MAGIHTIPATARVSFNALGGRVRHRRPVSSDPIDVQLEESLFFVGHLQPDA